MADGVSITSGAGTTIATDDCGAAGHAQIIKLAYSADGVATQALVDANGLEVQGAGVAGTPAGGVVSIQGVASGTVVPVSERRAATSTLANVSGSASSVTLQASNANRLALVIANDSTAVLYVKFGSAASATSYTYLLGPGDYLREELYTGIVTGIWASATGAARMTELTS